MVDNKAVNKISSLAAKSSTLPSNLASLHTSKGFPQLPTKHERMKHQAVSGANTVFTGGSGSPGAVDCANGAGAPQGVTTCDKRTSLCNFLAGFTD